MKHLIVLLLVGFVLTTAQTAHGDTYRLPNNGTITGKLAATSGPSNCYKASNGENICTSGIGCSSPNCAAHENANPQLNMASISNTTIPVSKATNANATSNEHDFRYGFYWGVDDYNSSSKDNSDLDFFVDSNNDVYTCQVGHDVWGKKNDLTNSTACRDGYVAGWKAWCKSDALDCAYWAATGTYPSLIAHAQKMGVPCIPWCLDRQSLAKGYRNDENILFNKGLSLQNLGNNTGAIEYYNKALAIQPHDADALFNKGVALGGLGNHTEAIKYFDKALAINPHDVSALINKGVALDKLGNYTEAIEYFDKALAINPHELNALANKGVALDKLGNYTGAILYYNKALAMDPKITFVLANKAAILDRLGNHTTTGNLTTSQPTPPPQNLSTSQRTPGQNETTSGNATTSTVIGPNPNATSTGNQTQTSSYHQKVSFIPDAYHSWRWNSGFTYGYLSLPVVGNHTKAFWEGYRNGTITFQSNKGWAEGGAHLPMSEHTRTYVEGYKQGQYNSHGNDAAEDIVISHLPTNSTDHNMHYYIGTLDGSRAADWNDKGDRNYPHSCPSGHTNEYCAGYNDGYNYESWAINDA